MPLGTLYFDALTARHNPRRSGQKFVIVVSRLISPALPVKPSRFKVVNKAALHFMRTVNLEQSRGEVYAESFIKCGSPLGRLGEKSNGGIALMAPRRENSRNAAALETIA
ncbi:hypothetical protein KM043_010949 [Ampulex compressa]|nr:hypothetical protein KM043_010949 [Ampulex compressa]